MHFVMLICPVSLIIWKTPRRLIYYFFIRCYRMPGTMPFTKQSLGKNIFNHWMTISVTLFLRVSMDGWLLTGPIVQLKAGSIQISFFLYQAFLAIPLHHKPQVSAVFPPISSFCSLLLIVLGEHISVPKWGQKHRWKELLQPLTNHLTLCLLCSASKMGILIKIRQGL